MSVLETRRPNRSFHSPAPNQRSFKTSLSVGSSPSPDRVRVAYLGVYESPPSGS